MINEFPKRLVRVVGQSMEAVFLGNLMECFGVVADDEACDLCWTQPSQTMYTLHIL
jgi:hypothetical protein